ncbi:MAG: hypothetical protein AAFZ52_03960 [Bacteroidota bacterium]
MLLLANFLLIGACLLHLVAGDRELAILGPTLASENPVLHRERWTMARAGWHWVSLDLFLAAFVLSLHHLGSDLLPLDPLKKYLALYFFLNSLTWLATITIFPAFRRNYLKLGQWLLLLVIAALLWFAPLNS